MRKKRLIWRFALPFFTLTVAALFIFTWYSTSTMKERYFEHVRVDLLARAHLVQVEIAELLVSGRLAEVPEICNRLGRLASTRITIIAADGTVLGDSMEDPKAMENHRERPEIAEALEGRDGNSIRYSRTTGINTMYAAAPVAVDGTVRLVIRTALPLSSVEESIADLRTRLIIGGLLITLLVAAMIFVLARRLTRPIDSIRTGAEQYAAGNLAFRIPKDESAEFGALADALTAMAQQLDERFRTIMQQRNEQDAVLSSMIEGVIAIDREERALDMNTAAATLFGVDADGAKGLHLQEAVRNTDIQRFATVALTSPEPAEGFMIVRGAEDRQLQLHGAQLRDGSGRGIGAVVVLHDVTRLRRLETLRRDFVANVSHELKTPVTSIKGFVETLLDGAADEPEHRDRFLAIIAKEAERLHHIIEDLLSLSRIEQEGERGDVAFESALLRPVLESAVESRDTMAKERGVTVTLECDPQIAVRMNAHLLEEAVSNLIDNAVKYSAENRTVDVAVTVADATLTIAVRDRGPGIPGEHLPRLFERFYRVDRARDRRSGSTGLGLAIAKHIVQAHGGTIAVESTLGEGSSFLITLPRK
ncbi:MAG: PAS domain-containing protein [Ignavibacteria bacterium]|nr:PAS domain-containing protein [Ignavibacteria bacterium]